MFTNVEIPRENLLMKYIKVTKRGEFIKNENEKIGYATMLATRMEIIKNVPQSLSIITCIGIRFSLARS